MASTDERREQLLAGDSNAPCLLGSVLFEVRQIENRVMIPAKREESADVWNAVFKVLANEDRRRLMASLLDHNPQEDSVQVPEGIHKGERELDLLQTEFVHKHLPLLEDVGYIQWDRDAHQVVKGPAFDEIRPLLTLIVDHQDELPGDWA